MVSEKVIRNITRPSTARCTLPTYIGFLLSEPRSASCSRLADVMEISHDSVNRFLNRESYSPEDLFNEAKLTLNLKGGIISVDDSVLDKPYAKHIAFVGHFWSGKHHAVVKGVNLITLYYSDSQGQHQPINFRIYDKSENKTKNDYFLDMLAEVLAWGLEPAFVTGDSWYSCVKNLKKVKNHQLGFLFALESNRLVSIDKGSWIQVRKLDIPTEGLKIWLRDFGYVKVFRTHLKDQVRHYAIHVPDEREKTLDDFHEDDFNALHDSHWQIEQYHRAIKQVCNVENFQVRSKNAVANHIFAAICGYVELQRLRAMDFIENCYELKRELFNDVIASFIRGFTPNMEHLNSKFHGAVNA